MKLTDEQIADWRENPITQAVAGLIAEEVEIQKRHLVDRYLSGQPRPDAERDAVLLVARWVQEFLALSPSDLREAIERDDDQQSERH